jgi:CheY-like chemotaxis protein
MDVSFPRNVLVVEDSPGIRRLVEVCLRPLDLTIATREDGPSGLAAVKELRPDVVILDIGLPKMDGWEVLVRIREDEAIAHIPVLVLTAHAEEESRKRADAGGADSFVTKPFQPAELRRQVLALLEPNASSLA